MASIIGQDQLFGRLILALHTRIFIGLVLGAVLGIAANRMFTVAQGTPAAAAFDQNDNRLDDRFEYYVENAVEPGGKIFLRLIMMVVVPLVFSALVLGVQGMGDVRRLGRVGFRTLALTLALSFTAVSIGLTLVNLVKPGESLSEEKREALREQFQAGASTHVEKAKQSKKLKDTLLDMIPENPLQEAVGAVDGSSKGNGMLAVMFFALIFGTALTVMPAERAAPLVGVLETVFDACMVIIGWAMRLAPYAVALLVFSMSSRLGAEILQTLGWFMGTALAGLAIHCFVVYPLAIRFLSGMSPIDFFRKTSEASVTAFGTSSSNATLPTSLRVATDRLGIPREIAHFVLTIGATGNQNGTALYEGVVVLFLAQVFGVDLTLGQQATVMLMSVLAGVGTAGVPGGSLPLIVIVLHTVGVPGEGIGIILGVDRILDMCRTVLNVIGDLVIAVSVGRVEGPEEISNA